MLSFGVLFTGIATLGAFLPVLPTTPFLILAMAAFARSSPALQKKLLDAPIFGAYLRQWNEDRSIPREAKWKAYGLIIVTFGLSIRVIDSDAIRIVLVVVAALLLAFMRSLRATDQRIVEPGDGESGHSPADSEQN